MKTKKYILLAKQFPGGEVRAGETSCGRGSCPAVLKTAEGKAIVVGRMLTKGEQAEIAKSGLIAFHGNEIGVEIDPELLRKSVGLL